MRLPGIQTTEAEPAVEGAAAAGISRSDGREGATGLELEEDGGTVPVKGGHGGRNTFRPAQDYTFGLFAGQGFAGAGGDKLSLDLGRQTKGEGQDF